MRVRASVSVLTAKAQRREGNAKSSLRKLSAMASSMLKNNS